MSVTIKDVAAVVGLSPSTVSRAFGRPDKVDEMTRRRIIAAADELGYRPNLAARAQYTGRTQCLGVILPDLENPFFAGVLKGIESAGDALGYQTLVADSGENLDAERRVDSDRRAPVAWFHAPGEENQRHDCDPCPPAVEEVDEVGVMS